MAHISWLPNKLRTTGIQLNSIKVGSIGHRQGATAATRFQPSNGTQSSTQPVLNLKSSISFQ